MPAPLQQIAFIRLGSGMQFDRCGRKLAFVLVGQPEGSSMGNCGVGAYGLFKFANVDGVTAGLDDFFHATDQPDHAETIALGKVAGAQPAIDS